jgi:hypothetical protein
MVCGQSAQQHSLQLPLQLRGVVAGVALNPKNRSLNVGLKDRTLDEYGSTIAF